ncbi:MAG: hypothetical protein ACRC62_05595 [Microcoleus sp.]
MSKPSFLASGICNIYCGIGIGLDFDWPIADVSLQQFQISLSSEWLEGELMVRSLR